MSISFTLSHLLSLLVCNRSTFTPTFLYQGHQVAKTNINIPFIAINLYHSTFLRNADPDLDENSGGSTDLDQN